LLLLSLFYKDKQLRFGRFVNNYEKLYFILAIGKQNTNIDLMKKPEKATIGENKIEIQLDPEIMKGIFSNVTNIGHTQEEFMLDFLFIQQQPAPFGKLVSRIIMTPNHAKRLLHALQENIRKYEENHGKLEVSSNIPPKRTIQ